MVREDGIRMALSRCPVIRFPYSEERGDIKRFGEGILNCADASKTLFTSYSVPSKIDNKNVRSYAVESAYLTFA